MASQLHLTFADWMKYGLPIMLILMPLMVGTLYVIFKPKFNISFDQQFEKIELNELKAQVQYAINTLPDYQKEVIILRFYYDLKIREIATITKASVSTVKSRLQQGIKKLERYLADFRGGDNV